MVRSLQRACRESQFQESRLAGVITCELQHQAQRLCARTVGFDNYTSPLFGDNCNLAFLIPPIQYRSDIALIFRILLTPTPRHGPKSNNQVVPRKSWISGIRGCQGCQGFQDHWMMGWFQGCIVFFGFSGQGCEVNVTSSMTCRIEVVKIDVTWRHSLRGLAVRPIQQQADLLWPSGCERVIIIIYIHTYI